MKKRIAILAVLLIVVGAWAADEMQLSIGWTYNKNNRKRILSPAASKYDVGGNAVIEAVISITTNAAGEALGLGDVTTPGFAWFYNLDTNNFVEIGTTDGTNHTAFLKLRAGEKAALWLGVAAPAAKATTNAVWLSYVIVNR